MSGKIKDVGPAFPQSCIAYDGPSRPVQIVSIGGMSLRDYFAAQALSGLDLWRLSDLLAPYGPEWREAAADDLYKMADAMLKAREAGKEAQ